MSRIAPRLRFSSQAQIVAEGSNNHANMRAEVASRRASRHPIHSQDLLHRVFRFRQVGIRHDAELSGGQRQEIDHEDDLFFGQPGELGLRRFLESASHTFVETLPRSSPGLKSIPLGWAARGYASRSAPHRRASVPITRIFDPCGEQCRGSAVDRAVAVGDFDVAPAFERGKHHEQVGSAVALVLVVMARRVARLHRHRHARFGNELL